MANEGDTDSSWRNYALKGAGTIIVLLLGLLIGAVKWQANTLYTNVLNHDERIRKIEITEATCCHPR